jgi:hypothetical protein
MVAEEKRQEIIQAKEKILSPLKPKTHSREEKNKNQKQLIQKEIYYAS